MGGNTPTADELADLIRLPKETSTVDCKREFAWSRLGARLELARDISCFANRSGGTILVGVKENGSVLEAAGLRPGDDPPDPTEMNRLLAKHFAPPPVAEVVTFNVDGKLFGAVLVREFADAPHICIATGNDENNKLVIREGDLYRRNDQMECKRIDARSFSGMIDSAITKRGAAYRGILGMTNWNEDGAGPVARRSRVDTVVSSQHQPVDPDVASSVSDVSQRAVDLRPSPLAEPTASLLELQAIAGAATVFHRYGDPFLPRGIDLRTVAANEVVRTPDGITVERSAASGESTSRTVLTVDRQLVVRFRETLWERLSPELLK